VLVGPAAEGGGFETFPSYKLARLSDEPSQATNAQAGEQDFFIDKLLVRIHLIIYLILADRPCAMGV